ncbi:ABC transporter ATP-binding protein [Natronorubrum daqingense]|uniref:ABC-2 type transport system ATP-binding protein n=1 Tax=Natronorubrum daqingense TaxID=588898 RepID=A0A1N7F915_9EURY|nr:ABC transporter ATP-binding protein [Natronorubrum daqingense]APX97623.1 copper ABC transporter ATP-binding protein [Natronorubrum daqingense]SIR96858.1 ABC-2 type transport system ATP-binding protein [Natronorubrum daqingense]
METIDISNVTKRYGSETALEDLSLTVQRGEIYGFLGPNGAGKSTTINLLLDFIRPTSGDVRVFGLDATDDTLEIRSRTGILPEGVACYDRLTGRQHVEFAIESNDAGDDPDDLLERVGIADAADQKAGGYSKGMAQRLMLATALVGEPDLLILDEPSTGLDPNGAREMREIIREENARGATVFFSSHVLGQVEAVCDRVGILRDGQLIAEDTVDGLRDSMPNQTQLRLHLDRIPEDASAARAALESLEGVSRVTTDGSTVVVTCGDGTKTTVMRTIEEYGVTVEDFATDESSLEDLFVAYTEGDARGVAQ